VQRLTAHPREHLTDAAVMEAFTGPKDDWSAGCELLDSQLQVLEDISDDLSDGEIRRNNLDTIHGKCTLSLTREFAWGTALFRPYRVMNGIRFNLGVYSVVTPEYHHGVLPMEFTCQGSDRLYLLNREVGDSYEVAANTPYLEAVRQAITDAGLTGVLLDGTAQDKVLPSVRSWPLLPKNDEANRDESSSGPTTWLRVVNDLLKAIGYRGIWADQEGRYRSEPYVPPAQRPSELTLDEGEYTTIQGPDRRLTRDMWKTPNKWVTVQTNRAEGAPAPTEGDGIYTIVNQSDGPTSIDQRGLVWARRYEVEAADQASLVAQGNQQMLRDRQITATWDITTAPLPVAGHFDVMTLVVDGASIKVQAHEWTLPLAGGDMSWILDEVVS
jgi:hypothetical protein